jgi:hypothetical protein
MYLLRLEHKQKSTKKDKIVFTLISVLYDG